MEEKKFDILMYVQLFLAIIVMSIGIYGKATENYSFLPFMLIILSAMFLIIGLREYKRTRSLWSGIFFLCVSLFIFFSEVEGIMIN